VTLCLDSIRRHTQEPYEILLVDNGSTDPGVKDYLRSLEDIILIDLPHNISMGDASAKAVALAAGEYVLALTEDTIVTPGWLKHLIKHFNTFPEIGVIGPRSNFVSGPQVVPHCNYEDIYGLDKFAVEWAKRNEGRLSKYTRLVGFCMFYRREVIAKIGWTDPRYGFGFDDDDISLRANLAGFATAIAQDVFIHHTGGPQGKGDPGHQRKLMEAWSIFKKKWGLPEDMPLNEYRPKALLNRTFDPKQHYIPLPDPEEVEPFIYKKTRTHGFSPYKKVFSSNIQDLAAFTKAMSPGLASYYLGRLDEAIVFFKKLASQYKNSLELEMALGCTLAKAHRFEESINHLKLAMDLQPNSCKPGNALGRALLAIGRAKEAEKAFREADKVSLYSHQAKFNLIRYYLSQRKNHQAVEIASEAFRRTPNNKVITTLAHILIISERYKEAIQYLRHYLTLAPKDADAFLLLLKAHWENRDKEKALEVLRAIKNLAQNDKAVSDRLSSLLGGHLKGAEGKQPIHTILQTAGCLFHQLNWEDDFSLDFLVKEDFLEALYHHAKALYENIDANEAFILYKELNRIAPDHPLVHNDLAAILWERGEVEKAAQHIINAAKLRPWYKDIVWNYGQILMSLGRAEQAESLYQQYLDSNPGDQEITEELAKLRADLNLSSS